MKLYYFRGACSLHPHIVLREVGVPFELVAVAMPAHKLHDGSDFYAVNPKGYVPVLELDDGQRLTEGAVIDQYVADLKPESKLLPPAGTMERYRAQEWLNFIASEVHKTFGPLFGNDEAAKEAPRARLRKRFDFTAKALASRPYLLGDTFGVADAYLYNMLRWAHSQKVGLDDLPTLDAFFQRVDARPAVQAALAAEKGTVNA
jgi:glutathione S-transferase